MFIVLSFAAQGCAIFRIVVHPDFALFTEIRPVQMPGCNLCVSQFFFSAIKKLKTNTLSIKNKIVRKNQKVLEFCSENLEQTGLVKDFEF